jgi:2-methylcitrate dehydratase PrpD
VPLLATALACAEAETTDGASIVLGYLIGFEVSTALGRALNPDHYKRGWHATATLGTLGCAATAARVLGLDAGQTRHALGVAASLASGLKENFGSMTKPFHAGHAARNGVFAALLAREGFTASDTALEGKQGHAAAFSQTTLAADAFDGLGQRWELLASGLAVKPYPSCALTHPAIDALLELRAKHGLQADAVEDVEVGVTDVVPDVLQHPQPGNALERKFSMQFCAAAALATGSLDMACFEDGPVRDTATRELMGRVRMVVARDLPKALEQNAWSRVTVRLRDGRTLASPPRGASGHPDQPLTDAQLRDKFLGCASPVLGADAAEALADQILHLEDVPDVRALTSRLVGRQE